MKYEQWINSDTPILNIIKKGAMFFDFLGEALTLFVSSKYWSMTMILSTAYHSKLARNHSWLVKKVADVAFKTANDREGFMEDFLRV